MTQFLRTRELCKAYPGVVAAKDVSLAIAAGEIIGFVGKNGAGKSTVVKMLAGVASPDSGMITIDDDVVEVRAPGDATKNGLFFVHQELNDIPELSVAENISLGLGFPRTAGLINWPVLQDHARHALGRLSHPEIHPKEEVGRLTIAQRRIVMIARALVQSARLIVLDEPSASLTDKEIDKLHGVVRALAADGVAVLYVSHRLQEILSLTSRILVMRDGALVATLDTGDLREERLIAEITGKAVKRIVPRAISRPEQTRPPALEVVDLVRHGSPERYSFTVHSGEVLGIAGLAGAGRTELMRAVVGADPLDAGRVSVLGRTIASPSPRRALAAGVALVSEDRRHEGGVFSFSVLRNITLSSLQKHRVADWLPIPSVHSEAAEVSALMDRLAIRAPGPDTPFGNLSGGNQQKALLARAMASNAQVLILDEPTHGIDVGAKEEIYSLVAELAERGKAIVFISSEFNEVLRVSDRIMVMREGRIVETIANHDLDEQSLLEHCYGERPAEYVGN